MSKSRKQRQTEKKKQAQQQKTSEQAVKPSKDEPVKQAQASQPDVSEIRMNFYSAMSMLTTIASAAAAVIAMIVAGRGFYYILQSMYKSEQLDITLLGDNLETAGFHPEIHTFLYICGIALALEVLFSLIGTVTAMNPKKKPSLGLSVAMILLSAAAVILYVLAKAQTGGIKEEFPRLEQVERLNLYVIELYVLIGNLVCTVVNLFGQMYGGKLYKKTGRTCA